MTTILNLGPTSDGRGVAGDWVCSCGTKNQYDTVFITVDCRCSKCQQNHQLDVGQYANTGVNVRAGIPHFLLVRRT